MRSRGIVTFNESDYRAYDVNKQVITVSERGESVSAIAVLYHHIVKSVRKRGAHTAPGRPRPKLIEVCVFV